MALLTSLGLLAGGLTLPELARAQTLVAPTSQVVASELQRIINEGDALERSRRWGDALGHYEAAIKQHPEHTELSERLTRSRVRFDIARRYSDSSFLKSITELTTGDSLELYGEVLLKVHTHYVEVPDWSHLVARGVASLDAALAEPQFVARHLSKAQPGQIDTFRALLPQLVASRTLATRQDAQALAAVT
jgi:carboxyl-terminal processing protease